jgi:hypothetical protein
VSRAVLLRAMRYQPAITAGVPALHNQLMADRCSAAPSRYARLNVLRRKPVRWVALAIRNAASAPDRMKRAPISM